MAPPKATDKTIAKELASVVRKVYHGPERDQLTVNYARQLVEEKLSLDAGFLKEGDWKAKSKQIILDTLKEVEDEDSEPAQQTAPPSKPKTKSASSGKKKRTVKAATPSDHDTEINDGSDSGDVSEQPAKKRKIAKKPRAKTKAVSDEEDEAKSDDSEGETGSKARENAVPQRPKKDSSESASELSDMPDGSPESKPKAGEESASKPAQEEDSSSELSSVMDEPPKSKKKSKSKATANPEPSPAPAEDANGDSSSELSSVIDEPAPAPKRKRKSKEPAPEKSKGSGSGSGTKAGRRAGKSSASGGDLSPEEAQIKQLQSQLNKCGVRKVWAFEFKKCGADTPKAKIARLKEMLAEVGMTGRFSEAKAREIREARELQADLQEVMQGEKSWGVGFGGRGARRRAARSMKEPGVSEDEEDDGDGDGGRGGAGGRESGDSDDEGARPAVRGRGPARRRADLAFLGDESESD